MDLKFRGKTALVLGGATGTGRFVALTLAQEGAKVVVADLHQESLDQTVRDIHESGGQALALLWDLSDISSFDGHMTSIETQFGQVDLLFNNMEGQSLSNAFGQNTGQQSKFIQAVVFSVIALIDWFLPNMKEKIWGKTIKTASTGVIKIVRNPRISNVLRMSLFKQHAMALRPVSFGKSVSRLVRSILGVRRTLNGKADC